MALTINGIFLKQLISGLASVEKGLAVLISEHNNATTTINELKEEVKTIKNELRKVRDNSHKAHDEINQMKLKLTMSCEKLKSFSED